MKRTAEEGAPGDPPAPSEIILAYENLQDPRDMAEVIHLAQGFGAEIALIGGSLRPSHWKVLRKLKSWRPQVAEHPEEIAARALPSAAAWVEGARSRGFTIVGTVLDGGSAPWTPAGAWAGPGARRAAVLFGEETRGLSEEALRLCEMLWTIPLGPGGRFYTVGQATAIILGGWRKA